MAKITIRVPTPYQSVIRQALVDVEGLSNEADRERVGKEIEHLCGKYAKREISDCEFVRVNVNQDTGEVSLIVETSEEFASKYILRGLTKIAGV